jgi:hypothetical protein
LGVTVLRPTTLEDLPKIREWLAADPWHQADPRHTAEFLLTGNGMLTFCLTDDEGPLCFVRLDKEGDWDAPMARLATQFGPESEVSKKRLVTGLLGSGIPAIILHAQERGCMGIVFESISPTLIAFMGKLGFKAAGGDDYVLTFGKTTNV